MHLNIKKLNSRKKKIAVTEFTEVWGHPFSILFSRTKRNNQQNRKKEELIRNLKDESIHLPTNEPKQHFKRKKN